MGVEFAAPAWLVGMPLAGLVWWWHRRSLPPRVVVAWLDPWASATPARARHGRRRRTDPRWWLRATVLCALLLALAEPRLVSVGPAPVTVWVDGSLSMRARQDGADRITAAARDVAVQARSGEASVFHVRSLANPADVVTVSLAPGEPGFEPLEAAVAKAGRDGRTPVPPAPGLLQSGNHWLVTDGSDAAVNDWAARVGPAEVFQGGAVGASNVQLRRLAVARSEDTTGGLEALATLYNAGDAVTTRTIELASGNALLTAREVTLPPRRATHTVIKLDAALGRPLTARIRPADVLPDDDLLTLATGTLSPVPYWVDDACPAAIVASLSAHPGLRPATNGRLSVRCEVPPGPGSPGQLAWLDAGGATVSPASAHWTSQAGELAALVPPATLWARDVPALPGDVPLLVAGRRHLVVQRASGAMMAGLDADRLAGSSFFPALMAGLLDHVADRDLLAPTVVASTPAPEADLAVGGVVRGEPVAPSEDGGSRLAPLLLLLAGALLLIDAAARPRRPAFELAGSTVP